MLLLDLCFGSVLAGGLRAPGAHAAAAALLWGLALLKPPDLNKLPVPWAWIGWIAWTYLSAAVSPEPLPSLAAAAYPATAALFAAMCFTYWKEEDHACWLPFCAAAGAAVSFAALAIKDPSRPMIGLLFPYYNYSAAFAAAVLSALAGAWSAGYFKAARRPRPLYALAAVLCLAELAFSTSRGAPLAALLACAFAFWINGKKKHFLLLLALAAILPLLLPRALISAKLKTSHGAAFVRPAIWKSALLAVAEAPLMGAGPGRFERTSLTRQVPVPQGHRPTRYGLYARHAHSEFLETAAETGIPGLALMLIAFGAPFFPRSRRAGLHAAPARAFAAALLIAACYDNIFALPALRWVLFSALCLCAASSGVPAALRRKNAPAPRPILTAGLVLSLLAWWPSWSVRRLRAEAFALKETAALEKMRLALSRAPSDPGLWTDLAYLHLAGGSPKRALAAMLEAERLHPTNAVYAMRSGEILLAAGNWPGALEKASRALGLEPVCPHARLMSAEAYLGLGRKDDARRELLAAEADYAPETFDPGYDALVRGLDRTRLQRLKEKLASL